MTKTRVPAVEGWFTTGDAPALLGSRCAACGTYAFPAQQRFCPNPHCDSTDHETVELSRTGTVWSFTNASYQPPPPYIVPGDEFEPFTLLAVELGTEKMVVLGQATEGVSVDQLTVGTPVELVVGVLYEDDEHEYLVWRWRPVGPPPAAETAVDKMIGEGSPL